MSYNGIGLSSTKGTGTSGYVQSNLAAVGRGAREHRQDNKPPPSQTPQRPIDPKILAHQRARKIEAALYDLKASLTSRGLSETEIAQRIQQERTLLERLNDFVRPKDHTEQLNY